MKLQERGIKMDEKQPIYRILLFSKIPTLDVNGWPDCGTQDDVGFYYNLDDAIHAMHENWCNIHEYMFMAGFILIHRQGLYESAIKGQRIYFEWDEQHGGFFEKEEPQCLEHFSY